MHSLKIVCRAGGGVLLPSLAQFILEGANTIQLYNDDCMVALAKIPSGTVDLVLTDPPYNIGKASWDKIENYVEWCGTWIKECERVLKDNGSFYFWHNDMVQIAQLMEWIRQNTRFVYNSFCIWDKGDFRALAWKNPSEENNLRSWFSTCEYCLFYTFQDETGLSKVLKNPAFYKLQEYFKTERQKTGMTATALDGVMRIKASYCYWEKPTTHEYRIPDEKNYKALQAHFNGTAYRREYEDLRREYEDLRYTHSLDANHNNVWKSTERNSGAQHACKKPTDILERIIRTSSKEGAIVLDCFMGSGSTGVACINTGRNFIGIELDEGYFKIAQERIAEAQRR
jgi:DNA modification methylase